MPVDFKLRAIARERERESERERERVARVRAPAVTRFQQCMRHGQGEDLL